MNKEEVAALQASLRAAAPEATSSMGIGAWRLDATSVFAWLAVGIPLVWGVWITFASALVLFR
jgi:hypothetical protein